MPLPRLLQIVHDAVFPPRAHERLIRGVSASELMADARSAGYPVRAHDIERSIAVERSHAVPLVRAYTLLPYADSRVAALVQEAKFHGSAPAARCLGAVLAAFMRELAAREPDSLPAFIVPVPLSRARRRARGYNQAERIARSTLPLPGVSLAPDLLARVRDTPPQTSRSGRERRANLAGAFLAPRPLDPRHTYMVVDDVLTTGQTLIHACRALQSAGARRIVAVALAHAAQNATVGKSGDVAEWSKAPHC